MRLGRPAGKAVDAVTEPLGEQAETGRAQVPVEG
jgi:hypothetical protein